MQSTRNLVTLSVKFSTSMKLCHHYLNGGDLLFRVDIHGDSTSIITDLNTFIHQDRHIHTTAITRQCFINAIIHDFKNKVVNPLNPRVSNIHGGSFPDGLKPFQDTNIFSIVMRFRFLAHCPPLPRC